MVAFDWNRTKFPNKHFYIFFGSFSNENFYESNQLDLAQRKKCMVQGHFFPEVNFKSQRELSFNVSV